MAIGIDSHKTTLAAASVDELGRELDIRTFPNHHRGHCELLRWSQCQGASRRIGIECSGSYGAALARRLIDAGEDVREVPAGLAHKEATRRRSQGKADPTDAVAIARVVARDETLTSPRRDQVLADLKLLSDYRDQLICLRTQLANRIHKDLVVLHPGYERKILTLRRKRRLTEVLALIRDDHSTRAQLIRRRIVDMRRLDQELAEAAKGIVTKLEESETTLTTLAGIGPYVAAAILGEVGDVGRIRSKAAFAQMNGTAPLQASSGATMRHRLSRCGNRKLNFALHYMALSQYRTTTEARAYVERKRTEGKSYKEAVRCLKRHLSNVVYRQLRNDLEARSGNAA